jgi:thiamine pyrophosphate-dependent acetolactate synthase large subunit-like protein
MKNRITGRSAFLALLKDEGITHLFGNPGTTELPIMHALKDHPDLTYVMAMQESLLSPWPTASAAPRASWSPATSMSHPASATRWARSTTQLSPARR